MKENQTEQPNLETEATLGEMQQAQRSETTDGYSTLSTTSDSADDSESSNNSESFDNSGRSECPETSECSQSSDVYVNSESSISSECTETAGNEASRDGAPGVDVEALVAEAEMRGYLRGRNESIEELMREPGMFQRTNVVPAAATATSEVLILNNIRKSVWE